ncbi:circumsporozoite protein-like [Drosophila bipectinata]|uniref:circumsporozoite protein-like n=1 Tax=Drosophila bipectinata TaxID=42026 RepID=UPI0038B251DA
MVGLFKINTQPKASSSMSSSASIVVSSDDSDIEIVGDPSWNAKKARSEWMVRRAAGRGGCIPVGSFEVERRRRSEELVLRLRAEWDSRRLALMKVTENMARARVKDCPNAEEEREGGQAAAHRRTPEGHGQGEGEDGTAAADPEDSGDGEEKGRRRKGATGQKVEEEDTADATPQTGEAGGEAVQGDLELEEGPGADAVARGAPDTVSTGEKGGAAVGEGAVGVAGAAEACAGPADVLPREAAGKTGAGAAGIGRRRARCAGRQLAAGACRKGEGGDDQAERKTRKMVHLGTSWCHVLPGARRR